MTTTTRTQALTPDKSAGRPGIAPWLFLAAGWLVPGAGHFMLRKWIRGTLILTSILAMYLIGMSLNGKIFQPNWSDPLELLGFLGDAGSGLPYLVTHLFDLGHSVVKTAVANYGTEFLIAAGLLNIIAAVDAHSLATGRKQS